MGSIFKTRDFSLAGAPGASSGEVDTGAACAEDLTADYSQCHELIAGHNNRCETRINLVITGINYTDLATFRQLARAAVDFDEDNQGLLAIEPFKSNKNKFNFFYVNEIGLTPAIPNAPEIATERERLAALCPLRNNKYVTAILNFSGMGNPAAMSIVPPLYSTASFRTFTHEMGHLIGNLNDEYFNRGVLGSSVVPPGLLDQSDYSEEVSCTDQGVGGRPEWYCLSIADSVADCETNGPWRDLIGNGCGEDGVLPDRF